MSPNFVRRLAVVGATTWALAACATSEPVSPGWSGGDSIARFQAATQAAIDCRAAVARDPRYALLLVHMPLDDVGKATLPDMIDSRLATDDEIVVLYAWTRAVGHCRDRLLQVTYASLPGFGPIIEQARDKDDAVYVMLARRKLAWGQGVMRLRENRTDLRTALIARADDVIARASAEQEQERNRHATILSSVIRIIP